MPSHFSRVQGYPATKHQGMGKNPGWSEIPTCVIPSVSSYSPGDATSATLSALFPHLLYFWIFTGL